MRQEFKNPGKEFRPIPFWSWNENLEVDELKRQIGEMAKVGMGGYFMHARSGLTTQYLKDEWFECIHAGIEAGKENNLDAWIYDEEGWPSGFAGGIVTSLSSDFHAKYITFMEYENITQVPLHEVMAAFILHSNNTYETVNMDELREGNVLLSKGDTIGVVLRKVQRFYIDVMNKRAVEAFLSVTHDKYYERFGESFGTYMKGFFTDEPRFTCNRFGELAWSDEMIHEIKERYGYDIYEFLPCLWKEYEGYEKIRYEFWSLANDLFVHNYMETIYNWCKEHNCMLTGHIMLEESIFGQMTSSAGVMPFYEYEDIPGIDWLRRRIESPFIAKQVGSVACQLGKKRVLTESFGLTGWNISFEEMKWILEWQYVNGVNMLCQHLQAYSLKGSRKRDYPPSFFIQQSWWNEFKHFTDYAGRLGYALSCGNQVADVLLLHPMRSGYTCFDGTRNNAIRELDNKFTEISNVLSGEHISYHYGDETIISKYGKVHNKEFIVGEISYKTVILPHMYAIDEVTLRLLLDFGKNGGTIISVGTLPSYTNEEMDLLKELTELVQVLTLKEILPFMKMKELVTVSIQVDGKEDDNIALQIRNTDDGLLLFMVNHNQEESLDANIKVYGKQFEVELLCTETGDSLKHEYENDSDTKFNLKFLPMQSYLVLLKETKNLGLELPTINKQYVPIGSEWNVMDMGKNSLTLDICNYRINGGELMGPIATIHLMKILLDMKQDVDIELFYDFNVSMDLSKNKEFLLAFEDSDKYEVYVNSKKVESNILGTWKDKSFETLDIKPFVQLGKNEIKFVGTFHQSQKVYDVLYGAGVYETELNKLTYDMEMESVYLIGDFGVVSNSPFKTTIRNAMFTGGPFEIVDKPTKFSHNNFTTQGLLFFAETITVQRNQEIRKMPNERIILQLGKQNAPLLKIYINGTYVKTSIWAPYEVDITDETVDGMNTITIECFASNRNLFGPHHHINGECYNVGPSSFTGNWSWVERESEADATDIADRTKNYWNDPYCFVSFGLSK